MGRAHLSHVPRSGLPDFRRMGGRAVSEWWSADLERWASACRPFMGRRAFFADLSCCRAAAAPHESRGARPARAKGPPERSLTARGRAAIVAAAPMSAGTTTAMWQGRAPSRTAVVAAALLRLLSLLLVAELSGTMHAVLDAAASAGLVEHPEDDCDEGDGHECPPGCSNCHCSHGAIAWSAPRMDVYVAVLPTQSRIAGFVPHAALPPRDTDRARLYRPPREHAIS